jgi:hypothetical protein
MSKAWSPYPGEEKCIQDFLVRKPVGNRPLGSIIVQNIGY